MWGSASACSLARLLMATAGENAVALRSRLEKAIVAGWCHGDGSENIHQHVVMSEEYNTDVFDGVHPL